MIDNKKKYKEINVREHKGGHVAQYDMNLLSNMILSFVIHKTNTTPPAGLLMNHYNHHS